MGASATPAHSRRTKQYAHETEMEQDLRVGVGDRGKKAYAYAGSGRAVQLATKVAGKGSRVDVHHGGQGQQAPHSRSRKNPLLYHNNQAMQHTQTHHV